MACRTASLGESRTVAPATLFFGFESDGSQADVQGAGVLRFCHPREASFFIWGWGCGRRNLTEQLVGGLSTDGVDAPADLGPQLLQRERGLPSIGYGSYFRFSDRVAQFGQTGFEQGIDGGNDQMGIVPQRKRAHAGSGCQDADDLGSEHRFEARAMLAKTTGQLDLAGAILVKAADQLLGRGAAEQPHEDDAFHVQLVLDNPVAEGVARGKAPASLLPAQTVGDALAHLSGQTLQDLVGREPT